MVSYSASNRRGTLVAFNAETSGLGLKGNARGRSLSGSRSSKGGRVDYYVADSTADGKVGATGQGGFVCEGAVKTNLAGYSTHHHTLPDASLDVLKGELAGAASINENGAKLGYKAQIKVVEAKVGAVGAHLGVNATSGGAAGKDGVHGKVLGVGGGYCAKEGWHISTPIGGVNLKWW